MLRDVAETGRRALVETGRLLHVIRDDADELGLNPAPGVADLDRLVQEFRAEGLEVDLSVEEGLAPLPAGIDVSAYRIAQEALTNALRYGGGTRHPPGDGLGQRCGHPRHQPDRTSARPPWGLASGCAALAERVSLLGGTLTHGERRRTLRARRDPAGGAGMTSVVIADDQDLVRSGLRMVLEARGVEVLGEASDGRAAVEAVTALRPDVVLMDIRMPVLDGIAATREIAARAAGDQGPGADDVRRGSYVYGALRAGAAGFLLKATAPDRLVAGLETVQRGGGSARAVADAAPDRAARPWPCSQHRRPGTARAADRP